MSRAGTLSFPCTQALYYRKYDNVHAAMKQALSTKLPSKIEGLGELVQLSVGNTRPCRVILLAVGT